MAVPQAGGVTSALNPVYTILSCGRKARRLSISTLRGLTGCTIGTHNLPTDASYLQSM
jgi:hypothetical protein